MVNAQGALLATISIRTVPVGSFHPLAEILILTEKSVQAATQVIASTRKSNVKKVHQSPSMWGVLNSITEFA